MCFIRNLALRKTQLVTMDYFCPNLQSHKAKISAGEGCVCIYKPLRGLHELMHGKGLHTA